MTNQFKHIKQKGSMCVEDDNTQDSGFINIGEQDMSLSVPSFQGDEEVEEVVINGVPKVIAYTDRDSMVIAMRKENAITSVDDNEEVAVSDMDGVSKVVKIKDKAKNRHNKNKSSEPTTSKKSKKVYKRKKNAITSVDDNEEVAVSDIDGVSKVVKKKNKFNNSCKKIKSSDGEEVIQKESVCKCTHTDYSIGSYKAIESPSYCKRGNELNGTKCAGLNCSNLFVASKTKDATINDRYIEFVPSAKSTVMACMHVNTCDHALCKSCYTKLLLSNSNTTGKGNRRSRRSGNE